MTSEIRYFVEPVNSSVIPVDHGYLLYSALCKKIPRLHEMKNIQIMPITGNVVFAKDRGTRLATLTPNSFFAIRGLSDIDLLDEDITLVKSGFDFTVHVWSKEKHEIPHSNTIYSRIMVSNEKSFESVVRYLAVRLEDMPVEAFALHPLATYTEALQRGGSIESYLKESLYIKRSVEVKSRKIIGYPLKIWLKDPEDSKFFYETGIGKKKKMGCGVFYPWTPKRKG